MPNIKSEISKSLRQVKTRLKMKQLAIVELELHAQWKENAFPEVSSTKPLSHKITKNSIILEDYIKNLKTRYNEHMHSFRN